MKILVTNDDGINAPGLWALATELGKVGEVVVFAPDGERSGIGTAITLHSPVCLAEFEPLAPLVKAAYAVGGTPADSVILALAVVTDVDVVVSGINRGANMGSDVLLSGTVGAALQGLFHGLPSIAISVDYADEMQFEAAARMAGLLVRKLDEHKPSGVLLNVNLPNLPAGRIGGVEVTRIGAGGYSNAIKMEHDGSTNNYRIAIGQPHWSAEAGTDMHAVRQGKVSITPLEGTLTSASGGIPFLDGSLPKMLAELTS